MRIIDLPTPTYVGTEVLASVRFKVPTGRAAVDPTVVMFSYEDGMGAITTWTYGIGTNIVRRRQGLYEANILLDNPGTWTFKVQGQGSCDVVDQVTFQVQPPSF